MLMGYACRNLKQIPVMDHNGNFHHIYFSCGEHHDRQNPNWKPFQLLERHCMEAGYDFFEALDMVQERIGRKMKCECDLLRG